MRQAYNNKRITLLSVNIKIFPHNLIFTHNLTWQYPSILVVYIHELVVRARQLDPGSHVVGWSAAPESQGRRFDSCKGPWVTGRQFVDADQK